MAIILELQLINYFYIFRFSRCTGIDSNRIFSPGVADFTPLIQVTSTVECLRDLMGECEVRASSRQAMVPSLTDASTETFWESGDEDRNKTKALTITCPPASRPQAVYVHIDNCRDLGVSQFSSVSM